MEVSPSWCSSLAHRVTFREHITRGLNNWEGSTFKRGCAPGLNSQGIINAAAALQQGGGEKGSLAFLLRLRASFLLLLFL